MKYQLLRSKPYQPRFFQTKRTSIRIKYERNMRLFERFFKSNIFSDPFDRKGEFRIVWTCYDSLFAKKKQHNLRIETLNLSCLRSGVSLDVYWFEKQMLVFLRFVKIFKCALLTQRVQCLRSKKSVRNSKHVQRPTLWVTFDASIRKFCTKGIHFYIRGLQD